jgi:hypothetical protein
MVYLVLNLGLDLLSVCIHQYLGGKYLKFPRKVSYMS